MDRTTRDIVRFHTYGRGCRLVARMERQSAVPVGAVFVTDSRRWTVDAVSNPNGVDYSIAYVSLAH